MRKLFVTEFVSLDGVIENPSWTMPYWNDDIAAFKAAETRSTDALLLGRVTYEGFAQAWPSRTDEASGGAFFNSVAKYVVSNTLKTAEWNNSRIISGNVLEQIRDLKRQPGKDIAVHGSGKLAQFLIKNNLVDTYRLLVYPVVLGKGQRLFEDGATAKLNLVESRALDRGVNALIYEPVPAE